jgi:hypothetical protein
MVNSGMVNAGSSYFSPTAFCESFRVFGRIPRFQNPFKYTRSLRINPKTQPRTAAKLHQGAANLFLFSMPYSDAAGLNKTVTRMRYIVSIWRGGPKFRTNPGKIG